MHPTSQPVINDPIMEERIARICYNENDWKRPSGRNGKGTLKKSFEFTHGFGHEEWLFDRTKIIDGYHYSFLQAVNDFLYAGEVFTIHLFAYSKTKGKLYLGVINNVECLDEKTARWTYGQYLKQGWINEMKEDIIAVGGDASPLDKDKDKHKAFNIRFRFEDVHVNLSNPKIISQDDPNTRAKYYKLYSKKDDFVFSPVVDTRKTGSGRKGTDAKSEKHVSFNTDIRRTTYDPQHNKIQNAVKRYLLDSGEYGSITLEHDFVDLMAETPSGEMHYFEVKTANAKRSIREALGQLLEYAYYPDQKRADKLFIIAPEAADEYDLSYLRMLRERFGIPVWFRHYSPHTKSFSSPQ